MTSNVHQRLGPKYAFRSAGPSRSALAAGIFRKAARTIETLGTLGTLFVLSGALFPLLHSATDPTGLGPPSAIDRLISWAIYFFIAWQAALRPRALLRVATRNALVPCVVLLAVFSVGWSIDPVGSLKEAAELCLWTTFGYYLVARYGTDGIMRLLAVALLAAAVLSLVFGLFAPSYGITPGRNAGAWRGVFIQKNQLGYSMVLTAVTFALLTWKRRDWLWPVAWFIVVLAAALTVLSHSKSALVVLIGLIIIIPTIIALRRGGRAAIAALCVLVITTTVAAGAVAERDEVLTALGKDPTLTGRIPLWIAVANDIGKRPLLGYGYRAFWTPGSAPAQALRLKVGWDAPHSHNAFLDMWLDLGVLGLSFFVGGIAVAVRRAWIALRTRPFPGGVWPMTFIILMIPLNMIASQFYEIRLMWALFVAVSVCETLGPSPRRCLVSWHEPTAVSSPRRFRFGGFNRARRPLLHRQVT